MDNWFIDHTGIGVSDIKTSAAFYRAALAPLGMTPVMCITRRFAACGFDDPDLGGVGFGRDYPVFWIDLFHRHDARQHTAFRATSRERVDTFHAVAIAAGGRDNGPPGLRTDGYPGGYYASFVLDPDGNNIEALYRE